MRRSSEAGWLVVVLGAFAVIGLLWLVVVVAPPWFVHGTSVERLKAQNEVRTTLLQGLAGIVLGVGAYFTYQQLHTAREGQITERYTRAIDQLGNDELDVRIGGIYALERIARDSPNDRVTIGEVLTAFIRGHAPWPPRLDGQPDATASIDDMPDLQARAPDVHASLTVLGRSGFAPARSSDPPLTLPVVDLRRVHLNGAHLEEVKLPGIHLEGALLTDVHLDGALLGSAEMEGATLMDVHLEGAYLVEANLKSASVHRASLKGANLSDAELEGAIFNDVDLKGADLSGARLEGVIFIDVHLDAADLSGAHLEAGERPTALMDAHLEGADLRGATADKGTHWPREFDWRAAGVIMLSHEEDS